MLRTLSVTRGAVIAACVLVMASCVGASGTGSSSGSSAQCEVNSQCPLGQICRNSVCIPGCTTNRDCPEGRRCNAAANRCETMPVDSGPPPDATTPDATRPDAGRRD
ncbi:MAG: hypothetical protein AB2A00_31480, partial [Myxococcota bacterium]